jgi:hypothetical protein
MSGDTTSWRLVILGALIGVSGPYGYQVVRLNVVDTRQYYTYQGTEGPFEGIVTDGELVAGPPKSTVKPGEWVAWRTTICFAAGVAVTADITLRALPNGRPLQMRYTKVVADTRCGPRVKGLQMPVDVPEGDYAIERLLLIEPDNAPAVSVRVPSIEFHVTR